MASTRQSLRARSTRRGAAVLSRRRKLGMAAAVVVLVIGSAEALCRLAPGANTNARLVHQEQLIVTLGFEALNGILEPDPDLFWRVKPLLRKRELSGRIAGSGPLRFRVTTDARGWRTVGDGSVPGSVPPSGAGETVLLLGDSCTFGIGVDDEQTVSAELQRRLPAMRVVNAGVPGYTAYQGRVLLEGATFERPPDVVVMTFGFNDDAKWDGLSDLEHARRLSSPSAALLRHSGLARWVSSLLARDRPDTTERPGAKRPRLTDGEYRQELRRIVRWCRAHDAIPVVVEWPRRKQLRRQISWPKQRALGELARAEGVRRVDLVTTFRERGDPVLFVDAIHASPSGCALAAEEFAEAIRSELADRDRR